MIISQTCAWDPYDVKSTFVNNGWLAFKLDDCFFKIIITNRIVLECNNKLKKGHEQN